MLGMLYQGRMWIRGGKVSQGADVKQPDKRSGKHATECLPDSGNAKVWKPGIEAFNSASSRCRSSLKAWFLTREPACQAICSQIAWQVQKNSAQKYHSKHKQPKKPYWQVRSIVYRYDFDILKLTWHTRQNGKFSTYLFDFPQQAVRLLPACCKNGNLQKTKKYFFRFLKPCKVFLYLACI